MKDPAALGRRGMQSSGSTGEAHGMGGAGRLHRPASNRPMAGPVVSQSPWRTSTTAVMGDESTAAHMGSLEPLSQLVTRQPPLVGVAAIVGALTERLAVHPLGRCRPPWVLR